MRVAIIADDLTGAADTGVQLARAGYRTAVAFRDAPIPSAEDLDAVVLDTDSRAMPSGFAARRVLGAVRSVRHARIVYKKLDSTLRGPIAAELAAALGASGRGRAVVAPAFPAAGRTTVDGVQLVRGVPVQETEARDDPRTPVREGHVPTLLAAAFSSVVSLGVEDLADPATVRRALEGAECVVADAARGEDLEALVRAVPDPSGVLWAGSAGLAVALGGVYPGPGAGEPPSPRAPVGKVLVVVGSLSGVARRQLRTLEEHGCPTVPVVGRSCAVGESLAAARRALSGGACAAVHSTEDRGASEAVSFVEALAEVVGALSEEGLFDALVLTGGETAVGVARRLGANGIRLEGEVAPGIPVGILMGPTSQYRVVTKAGAFGEPGTLVESVETLLEGREG
jgi:D-threonate/D-erythronate kinase